MLRIARWQHPAIASCLTRPMLARSLAMASRGRAKTITAGMHSDLRITDPGLTTRDHGYMVYDMLLARDWKFEITPFAQASSRRRAEEDEDHGRHPERGL